VEGRKEGRKEGGWTDGKKEIKKKEKKRKEKEKEAKDGRVFYLGMERGRSCGVCAEESRKKGGKEE
jgi:hypothetical protein